MRVKNLGTALGDAEKSDRLMLHLLEETWDQQGDEGIVSRPVSLLRKYPYALQRHFAVYEGPVLQAGLFAHSVPSLLRPPVLPPCIFLLIIYLKFNSINNRQEILNRYCLGKDQVG